MSRKSEDSDLCRTVPFVLTRGETSVPENQIANLIAKHFIARSDVKAVQFSNGNYAPHLENQNDPEPIF
jgi:hypothetical protein